MARGGFFQKAVGHARYYLAGLMILVVALSVVSGQCAPPDNVIRETDPATGETQVIRMIEVPSLKR